MTKQMTLISSLVGLHVEHRSSNRGRVNKDDEVAVFRASIEFQIDKVNETTDRQLQLVFIREYMESKKKEPYYSSVVRPYGELKIASLGGTTLFGGLLKMEDDEYEKIIRDIWTSTAPYMRGNMQKEIIKMYLVRKPDGLKGAITTKEKAELYG